MADLKKTIAIEISAKTEKAVSAFKKLTKAEKASKDGTDKLGAAEKALTAESKKLANSTRVMSLQLRNSKARLMEMQAAAAKGAMRMQKLRRGMGVAGKAAGLMAAAVTAAGFGMFKLVDASAKTGDEIAKTAKGLGVTTRELQRLRFAAERSGGSAATMNRGLRIMTVGLQDAVTKGTGPAFEGLQAIGLEASELQKLGMEDQFSTISEALKKVGNQSTKSAITMKIFGARGGSELKPLMDEGADGIRALGDEAERLGLVMSDSATKAGERFVDSMLDAKGAVSALGRDIGSELLPKANETVDVFKEWVVENRELIKQDIGDIGHSLADGLQAALPAIQASISALSTMTQTAQGLFLIIDDITGKSFQHAAQARDELNNTKRALSNEFAGESFDRLRLRQEIGAGPELSALVDAEVDRRVAPAIAQAQAQAAADQRLLVGGSIRDKKPRGGRGPRDSLDQSESKTLSDLSELSGQGSQFGTSREDTALAFAGAGARDPFQTDEQSELQFKQGESVRIAQLEAEALGEVETLSHDQKMERMEFEIMKISELDEIRQNSTAEQMRLTELAAKREAAAQRSRIAGIQAVTGIMGIGADAAALAAQTGAVSAEKSAIIQNKFLGMQAAGIAAIEATKAAASFASFNFLQGGFHTVAAAFAGVKAGLLLSGALDPGGGSPGGGGGAGSATQFGPGTGGGGPVGGSTGGGGGDLPAGPISRPDTGGTSPPQPGASGGRNTSGGGATTNINITTLGTSNDEVWTTVQQKLDDNKRRVGSV